MKDTENRLGFQVLACTFQDMWSDSTRLDTLATLTLGLGPKQLPYLTLK